jgi:hypothetical protein
MGPSGRRSVGKIFNVVTRFLDAQFKSPPQFGLINRGCILVAGPMAGACESWIHY